MSDEENTTESIDPAIAALQGMDAVNVGVVGALRAAIIAVHNEFGRDIIMNAVAQYVLESAAVEGDEPRNHWNEYVTIQREIFFKVAGLDQH